MDKIKIPNDNIENINYFKQDDILTLIDSLTSSLRIPIDSIFSKSKYIKYLLEQLSVCVEKMAFIIHADIWLISDVTDIDTDNVWQTENLITEINNKRKQEREYVLFKCSQKVLMIKSEQENIQEGGFTYFLRTFINLLDGLPKKYLQENDDLPDESRQILKIFDAWDLLIIQEYFLERKIFICLGNSRKLQQNNPLDAYRAGTVKFIDNIIGLIAVILQSYNVVFSYDNLDKTIDLKNRDIWMQNASNFIYAEIIDLQKRQQIAKDLEIKRRYYLPNPLSINDENSDEIISNYLRILLWDNQKKQYKRDNRLFRFTKLIDLFSILKNEKTTKKNFNENLQAGNFGFYIEGNEFTRIWIPIGSSCSKTHHELYVIHEFIYHQLECYLLTLNNGQDNNIRKYDGKPTDEEIIKYKEWKRKFENYKIGIINYLQEFNL